MLALGGIFSLCELENRILLNYAFNWLDWERLQCEKMDVVAPRE